MSKQNKSKKLIKKKPLSKKEAKALGEEIKKQIALDKLNHEKEIFNNYCEVLAEYDLAHLAQSGNRAKDLAFNETKKTLDVETFSNILFGKNDDNLSKEENDTIYYQKLNKILEDRINKLHIDIRKKIVKDYAESWYQIYDMWKIQSKKSKENKKK